MSTVYDKTDNYSLSLYGDNDPADLRDGYNGSMRTIDDTLEKHLNRIESVESRETHNEEVTKALLGDNTVDNATTAKTKWDKAGTDAAEAMADAASAVGKVKANTDILTALGADTAAHAAANKTKWDKAGADAAIAIGKADSNKDVLDALGADSPDNATAAKIKWDKNTTDIAALSSSASANAAQIVAIKEKLGQAQYSNGYLVTFGDSYAENTMARTWSYQLSTMLPELTWKNYAKAGAGFNVSNIPTFAQQVANCVADASVDNAKVKVAVCAGGRNDVLNYNTGRTKAQECVSAMRSAFPNAVIVVAPMLFDSSVLDENGMQKYSGLLDGCKDIAFGDSRIVLADGAYVWCKGNTNWFPSGDIHPNEYGAKAIAKYLYTACRDSYRGRQEYAVSMFGSMPVEFLLQNAMITASGQGQIPSIGAGHGGELAKWCLPRHNIWSWIVTGGNSATPRLGYIQPNGTWGVFNPVASDQGNCSFIASYAA